MNTLDEFMEKCPIIFNGQQYYSNAGEASNMYQRFKNQTNTPVLIKQIKEKILQAKRLEVYEYYSGLEIKIDSILELVWLIEELEDAMEMFASILPLLANLKYFYYGSRFYSETDYSCFTSRPPQLTDIRLGSIIDVPPTFLDGIKILTIDEYYGQEKIPESVEVLTIIFYSDLDGITDINELKSEFRHLPNLQRLSINCIDVI